MERIIIIGGMGPQASLDLHRRILKRSAENGSVNGGDFPHIVHFSLPIDDFISDATKTKEAFAVIITNLREFTFHSGDIVVLACNTAHLMKNDIERALNIHITSLIDLTTDFIAGRHSSVKLLASPTTIQTGLYTGALIRAGVNVLLPSEIEATKTEKAIRSVIAFETPEPLNQTCIPILLGCTELSCAFGNDPGVIDPMNILIETIMPRKEML